VRGESSEPEELREETRAWWVFLIAGLVGIAAGVIVLAKPADSLVTVTIIAGIFILVAGAFELAASLSSRVENRGLAAVLGVVSVVVGILLIRHPIGGVLVAALLIGFWLIAGGIVRMVAAFERSHRVWQLLLALVEVAAGVVLVSSPAISFATLALIVGISFIANGVATFALGWMLHALRAHSAGPGFTAGAPA
jgi:uncharacterized membrane protein HdeD (DUF308 family)